MISTPTHSRAYLYTHTYCFYTVIVVSKMSSRKARQAILSRTQFKRYVYMLMRMS